MYARMNRQGGSSSSQRTGMFAPGQHGVGHQARVLAELAQLMIEVSIGIMEDGPAQCLHRSEGHYLLVNVTCAEGSAPAIEETHTVVRVPVAVMHDQAEVARQERNLVT